MSKPRQIRTGDRSRRSRVAQRRGVRVSADRVFELARHLTWRDREIAKCLYDHQALATGQLELLFFSSRRRCQDRLLFLYRERVIDRFYPHGPFGLGKPQAHWLLGEAGAILVASSLGVEPARHHRHCTAATRRARARTHGRLGPPGRAPRPHQPDYFGRIRWRNQDFESTPRVADRPGHVRPSPGDPHRARQRRLATPRQPLRLPALRRRSLRTLRARLHRHVSTRQRRHLPLLRVHGPPEVRS
jgi:Replication-relaxation